MALHTLVGLELSVPDPDGLIGFWERRGLVHDGAGGLGSVAEPGFLRVREGAYRHLSELRLGCDHDDDLRAIAQRLSDLGVESTIADATLRCDDPVFDHRVVIEVGAPRAVVAGEERAMNRPNGPSRPDVRSEVITEAAPRPPRRVGHFVLGTDEMDKALAFFLDGLGFKISDRVGGGIATFMRCSTDHHNVMLMPGATSYLNHYALEMDDIDAVGVAGQAVLAERPDAGVVGVGRHLVGSNVFWYLLDPSGTMFELFADMDQIVDDDRWDREQRRDDWPGDVAVWGPPEPSIFYSPSDIDELVAARAAAGR